MDDRVGDRHREALRRLVDYDRQRQAQLTRTLEEFLRQRGNISATAQSLYVHPNTLRQRLRRIADLTRIDVKRDDWLMIEIALKLLKLEDAARLAPCVSSGRPRPRRASAGPPARRAA